MMASMIVVAALVLGSSIPCCLAGGEDVLTIPETRATP